MKTLEEIQTALEALETRATEATTSVEEGATTATEAKALVEELRPQIETLTADRDKAVEVEERKAMKGELSSLQSVLADLRKPSGEFTFAQDEEGKSVDSDDPYRDSGSVFADIRSANRGITAARDRLLHGFEGVTFEGKALSQEGKAMTEGTNSQGGYLVRPHVERQIVEARELDNVLRGLCSTLNVTTTTLQLDQLGLTTTAGWVAELAQKPESTGMTLASITASIFQAAGLATISNQLLADSNPAVDGLVTRDLGKRLVALEEAAFISGTGTGQPLGILNTPGLGATPLTSTTTVDLLDAILDAIAAVETSHGAPNAILMHPRTWTKLLKSKDAQGAYYIDPQPQYAHPSVQSGRTALRGPTKSLWGYPVVTSNRVPTNLGAGTNESRVIVGDYAEALILDRQGITVDESSHVLFTSNATIFRAEQRVGFTAARTPLAFNVVGGVGLANA